MVVDRDSADDRMCELSSARRRDRVVPVEARCRDAGRPVTRGLVDVDLQRAHGHVHPGQADKGKAVHARLDRSPAPVVRRILRRQHRDRNRSVGDLEADPVDAEEQALWRRATTQLQGQHRERRVRDVDRAIGGKHRDRLGREGESNRARDEAEELDVNDSRHAHAAACVVDQLSRVVGVLHRYAGRRERRRPVERGSVWTRVDLDHEGSQSQRYAWNAGESACGDVRAHRDVGVASACGREGRDVHEPAIQGEADLARSDEQRFRGQRQPSEVAGARAGRQDHRDCPIELEGEAHCASDQVEDVERDVAAGAKHVSHVVDRQDN